MASIRKSPRNPKRWELRYRDPAGKQRTRTFDSRADAKAYGALVEADKGRGVFRDPTHDRVTFADWHKTWWPTIEGSDRAANTIILYEGLLRTRILPYLGHRRLIDLRRIDIETWLADLRLDGLSGSTLRTCRTVSGMLLTSAMEAGIIIANPQARIKISRKSAPSRAQQALTADELELLADVAEKWGYRLLVLVMGYTGLRPNEAFALRRRHLDDFGNLIVSEGLVEVRGRLTETDGKTHTTRIVPVAPSVLAELRAKVNDYRPDQLLFLSPRGRPIGMRRFRDILQRAAAEAGLPDWFVPYCLRHTCASLMAQRGVPVTTAAALMGHDPAIYLRTYAHLYPGDLGSAALALDGARPAASCGADVVQRTVAQ